MKNTIRQVLLLGASMVLVMNAARSEDIDIFLARSGDLATSKPNLVILLDNSANWSRASQKWPDNNGVQGEAELNAIAKVVNSKAAENMNIGLAGYTSTGSGGGYVRFGVRDMSLDTHKAALSSIVGAIDPNDPTEKVDSGKTTDNAESASMFEMYRYFKGLPVFRGAQSTKSDPAWYVDISGNAGTKDNLTAYGLGLTTGHAYEGSTYLPPSTSTGCTTNALVMVVNNAQGTIPAGNQSYAGVSVGAALPQISGVTDPSWTDEWARFLFQNGIRVYILDAYNAQQNKSHSLTLERAANLGGGGYFPVRSQAEIEVALDKILAEINARESTFASAALPVSTTNRSQYLNQVFIGMFRPDSDADPRWLGNLKRYSLSLTGSGDVQLTDQIDQNAISSTTGFVNECAVSYWTSDSPNYWLTVKNMDGVGASSCTVMPTVGSVVGSTYSDMPDGPTVAKGGVAEVIRKGNNPPSTNTTPAAWSLSNRKILTYSGTTTTAVTATIAGWTTELFQWVTGRDDDTKTTDGLYPYSEYLEHPSATARVRPSLHGDVIHSRPLPVNYGTSGVTVYYGANDGMLRAVDASTGRERWAFVAPEHFAKFKRLKDNTPPVKFDGIGEMLTPPEPKDYFFDGSIGLYQNEDNSSVWIYPSQRRGGRMLYGIDVTNPDSPQVRWRVGCPNLADDTGCTNDKFKAIGQTWSMPTVAMIAGRADPVVIVGGGYDNCEDTDSATSGCTSSRKGNVIYVLDAFTGAVVRDFSLPVADGGVAADISLADRNGDGYVDFAYAVTTGGAIYRINFTDVSYGAVLASAWGNRLIGYTRNSGRKFLNAPALMPSGTKMYVALGTGDREKPLLTHYPYTTPVTNRFYVLVDDVADPAFNPTAVNMDDTTKMKDYSAATSCDTEGVGPDSSYSGWFMDLPYRGEQTTTTAVAVAGMVTFSTNRPYSSTESSNVCSANLGEARGYWLNILNGSGAIGVGNATCGGSRATAFVQGGLVPSPTLATVQIGNTIQTVALGAIQRSGGASSGIAPQAIRPPIKAKRRTIYWRSKAAD
jgi:type IV pilus assembly protein PilY1